MGFGVDLCKDALQHTPSCPESPDVVLPLHRGGGRRKEGCAVPWLTLTRLTLTRTATICNSEIPFIHLEKLRLKEFSLSLRIS